jgi:hypothetical protein
MIGSTIRRFAKRAIALLANIAKGRKGAKECGNELNDGWEQPLQFTIEGHCDSS